MKQPTPTKKGKKFSRNFRKDDARHYVIYAELSKMKVAQPYLQAETILEALKRTNLL